MSEPVQPAWPGPIIPADEPSKKNPKRRFRMRGSYRVNPDPDCHVWRQFAELAVVVLAQFGGQIVGPWLGGIGDLSQNSGRLADEMLSEYRTRFPIPPPEPDEDGDATS